jgi:hypothetical protein
LRTILAFALALAALVVTEKAHAFGAIGYLGYGHTFGEGGDNFGPTLEVGGSFSVPIISIDITYWTDLDDASNASQVRIGGRLKPPLIPLYGRLAIGLPLDGDTRDALGADIIIGAGYTVFSLPLISVNLELDYNRYTGISDIHPLEIKAGVAIGF